MRAVSEHCMPKVLRIVGVISLADFKRRRAFGRGVARALLGYAGNTTTILRADDRLTKIYIDKPHLLLARLAGNADGFNNFRSFLNTSEWEAFVTQIDTGLDGDAHVSLGRFVARVFLNLAFVCPVSGSKNIIVEMIVPGNHLPERGQNHHRFHAGMGLFGSFVRRPGCVTVSALVSGRWCA